MLAATCWPGPLTLLLLRAERVLDVVTGGRDTIGLRVPAHPVAQELLARSGRGVAAPSANRFGRVSPTTARHVVDDLGPLLDPRHDVILDGGASPIGVESTIVDCTVDPPQLLRPGGIPAEDIERLLDQALAPTRDRRGPRGCWRRTTRRRRRSSWSTRRRRANTGPRELTRAGRRVEVLDLSTDLVRYARELYSRLRDADAAGADVVVAVLPPPRGLGHAIRDRLTNAAAATRP